MADLGSSPHRPSSAGDVDRALKTEADDQRDSSSLGLSSSPHRSLSPPPPAQTMPNTQRPQVRPPATNGTLTNIKTFSGRPHTFSLEPGAADDARRAQERNERRPSKTMSIQELVDGPFTRFGTQSEIVLPFQERAAQEDSSRKGTLHARICTHSAMRLTPNLIMFMPIPN